MSLFDSIMTEASDVLMEAHSTPSSLRIIPPGGGDGVPVDAIIGRVRIEAEDDADSMSLLMEVRTVQAKYSSVADTLRIKADLYIEADKVPWAVASIADGDAPMVVFEVERRHITDRSRSRRGDA